MESWWPSSWAVAIAVFFQIHLAFADLPIHCSLQDAAGDWTFRLGPGAPLDGKIPSCGHSYPNTVEAMLKIDRDKVVPPESAEDLEVTLTEQVAQQPQRHLLARSGATVGMWTMVFDTGMEVRVGDHSLTAHFLFEALPNASRAPKNGDNFESIGLYKGRNEQNGDRLDPKGEIYSCHCGVTSTGWWHRRLEDGGLVGGCLWAAKKELVVNGRLKSDESPPVSSLVRLVRKPTPDRHRRPKSTQQAISFGKLNSSVRQGAVDAVVGPEELGEEEAQIRGSLLIKEVISLSDRSNATSQLKTAWASNSTMVEAGSSRRSRSSAKGSRSLRAPSLAQDSPPGKSVGGKKTKKNELPANFDWREELKDMVKPGDDPLGVQVDQGACGSCYAFAGIMTLQMRFRVQLWKKHKLLYPVELSYKSAARCSPYTEGCNGGFQYFIFRQASEVGVPLEVCDHNVSASDLDRTCNWKCYENNPKLFYAKDYWHIGGFSHGSDEESIMREIYENGPVELGFSTTAIPEFVALSGQSVFPDTEVMTLVRNGKPPKETYSTNDSIHRWWWSTHAILAVGWGEEINNWGMVKYWIVRNSWGRSWGDGGYAKMRRGNNDGAIETDASMVIPDMDRLPDGFLKEAENYHTKYQAQKALWKSERALKDKKIGSSHKGKRGVPDYCKRRPNSPDCQ
eukprot:gnl/TRDRNA2_/TRDRNA2_93272_c0_seq4.p1 gnl/TRDRNA2_/TRDRNA2_93272_c0~~gnl/TRDRNA2_/TRDRNA2_93272_c0_seq4.p1  ORF type:complete len:679 (+),score=107.85 gnl/TRDRNA2_/TRDRNA2_93272_c0_seq4:124-2160(+)